MSTHHEPFTPKATERSVRTGPDCPSQYCVFSSTGYDMSNTWSGAAMTSGESVSDNTARFTIFASKPLSMFKRFHILQGWVPSGFILISP